MPKGLLLIVSGPSGVGKGSILEAVIRDMNDLTFSVSATTRAARPNEKNGIHYHFITKTNFEQKVKNNDFLEWAMVHDAYYGTPKDQVEMLLNKGKHVVLDVDVQGALQIKRRIPDSVFIFIVPPSLKELRRRLENRHTEKMGAIEERLQNATEELYYMKAYDYIIVNDILEEAIQDVKSVIRAEKCKTSRKLKEIEDALSTH